MPLFDLFGFPLGAPPYRGYHWLQDDELTIPVFYRWIDLSAHLKRVLDPDDDYDLNFAIYKNTPKGRDEMEVDSLIRFTVQQGFEEGYHLRVYKPMRRGYVDIGVFVPIETSLSTEKVITLFQEKKRERRLLLPQLNQLVSSFGPSTPLSHAFIQHPPLPTLSSHALDLLKRHADFIYADRLNRGEVEKEVDLQISLKREELTGFIGCDTVRDLDELFGQTCEDIVLRRCNKMGHYIDFHLDYSIKTMQVAVVDDREYEGGRLAYVVKSETENENEGVRVEIPDRKKGSITSHDNGVIHGVTPLYGGVRYGLLVLDRGSIVPGTR